MDKLMMNYIMKKLLCIMNGILKSCNDFSIYELNETYD